MSKVFSSLFQEQDEGTKIHVRYEESKGGGNLG